MIITESIQEYSYQADTVSTSGIAMGPKSPYMWCCVSSTDKKAYNNEANFLPRQTKRLFSETHPYVDEGVLRIWDLRLIEVGGVQVIGWPREDKNS